MNKRRSVEAEANAFAFELLMPEAWLKRDIGPDGIDIEDDKRIAKLAQKYRVSVSVMTLRIGQLMGLRP